MSWEDKTERVLDVCMNTFGVDVDGYFIYVPASGVSHKVRGIFDMAFQSADPNTHAAVTTTQPILGVKLSDLPVYPQKGDKVIVKDVTYRIIEVQKDVHGGASLYLHKL